MSNRGTAEGKWIFPFLSKWVINHRSFTYSLTITHTVFLLMWQRNNYRWKMACLFILYTNLVPHLHDLKKMIFLLATPKGKRLLGPCSSQRLRKGCRDEQQGSNQAWVPFIFILYYFCARNKLHHVNPGLGWERAAWSRYFSLVARGYLPAVGLQRVLWEGAAKKPQSSLYAFPLKQVKGGEQK